MSNDGLAGRKVETGKLPGQEANSTAIIRIEAMTFEDINAVREIDVRSASLPWPISSYEYEIRANRAGRSYVAKTETGRVVGFLIAWLILDEFHIANIAVDPDFRRRSIGFRLMQHGLSLARSENARESFLEVRAGNIPAIRLYEKIGYRAVSIRKGYYRDNNEDALNMNLYKEDYQLFLEQKGPAPHDDKNGHV